MIVVTGQTATGKTGLAETLAKKHNGELVNFDSRQIYKHLDIITGKDRPPRLSSRAKRSEVEGSVWLYDIITPDQHFSSHDFVERAQDIIAEIERRGKTPILVGGTYLYLKHLLYGFDVAVGPDFKLRKRLNSKNVAQLQTELKKLNPVAFKKMNYSDQQNPRRLIRKIEISYSSSGIASYSSSGAERSREEKSSRPARTVIPDLFIGLRFKSAVDLRRAIKIRVEKRLKQGAIKEVKSILKKGYKEIDPGLQTIGSQELIKYLKGELSKEKAIEEWINHEVQYAKRQYTFMKKDKNIIWREI
jgi:tRNA dimethylallyltransferase